MLDVPQYPYSLEYAMEHEEASAYHISLERNRECAAAIDKAIDASCYDQYHYNLNDALNAVVKDFGLNRVTWVAAATLQHFSYDGRLSYENLKWAQRFPIPVERENNYFPRTHLLIFDGFVTKLRKARLHELAQAVGAYEKSHHMADRNRLTEFKPEEGIFTAKRDVTEDQLSERMDDIAKKRAARAEKAKRGKNRDEMER